MPVKTRSWISLWFLVSAPLVLWDVGYCFMRPRSFKGGDLHWIWKPYALYQKVDLIYSPAAYEAGDGFTNAQALLNVIETLLNIAYLYLAHVKQWSPAAVIGFGAAIMTLWKTVLYWMQEYYCNFCTTGHNTFRDLFVLWIVPNGFWIVVPSMIVYCLGKDLIESLDHLQEKEAVQKTK